MNDGGRRDFDVVVIGASIAGCTTATLYARKGLRVALLERKPNMDAYKVVCAHFIQGGATPMLQRHGFDKMMEAAGGVRNRADLWTRWGWIRGDAPYHGYTLRREVLDPMLRGHAAETPGVELMLGHGVKDLIWSDGKVTGVEVATRDGQQRTIRASLVVAADGRGSQAAKMARVPGRVLPHGRFAYWAYVRGLPRKGGAAEAWFLDPDVALIAPCDGDLHCVVTSPTKARLPEFKRDLESAWLRFVEALPEGPPIADAERVSKFIGKLDTPNVQRPGAGRGMAFVGDAAISSDPVWAVGCGWAFQSSEWLVGATAEAIRDGADLDKPLARYRRKHAFELTGHHVVGSYYATGRRFNLVEKLFYAAAPRDPELQTKMHTLVTRAHPAQDFVRPGTFARAFRALATSPRPEDPVDTSANGGAPESPATNGISARYFEDAALQAG